MQQIQFQVQLTMLHFLFPKHRMVELLQLMTTVRQMMNQIVGKFDIKFEILIIRLWDLVVLTIAI
jgi:hypothetical protein